MRGRRLTRYEQVVERLACSPAGAWAFVHLFSAADRLLLPATRGRMSIALGAPVGLLETIGARTGRRRRAAVLYLIDHGAVVVIASNGGRPRHPGWLHNVRARPEVRLLTAEHGWGAYRGREAIGAERTRRWTLAIDFYAGYAVYQDRSGGRETPVVVLEPVTPQVGVQIPPAT